MESETTRRTAPSQRLRFGPFEADLGTAELWRDDELVALGGKPFDVLAELLRHPGELVDRRQLRRALWPAASAVDGDKSLNAAIKTLRRALDDSAEQSSLIETLRGRGYRLMVEVMPVDDDPVRRLRLRGRLGSRGRLWVSAGLVLLALIPGVLLLMQRSQRESAATAPSRLAVLPLAAVSGGEDSDQLAAALTEELTTRLTCLAPQRLAVVGRLSLLASLRQPMQQAADTGELARRLDADYLVEGSVVGSEEPPRIHLRLLDVESGTQLWATAIDQGSVAIPELLAGLEAALLRQLGEGGGSPLPHPRGEATPVNAAHQLYLRARMTALGRTWEAVEQSQHMAEQAAELDPQLVAAQLLAAEQAWLRWLGRRSERDEALGAAEAGVARALALAPELAAAHTLQAEIRLRAHLDWQGAEEAFRRALAAAPADSEVRHRHAWYLLAAGRHHEARQEMALALELDPLSAKLHSDLGWFHYRASDFAGALEHCYGALEIDGTLAPAAECRYRALAHLGRCDEARQEALSSVAALDPPASLLASVTEAGPEAGYQQLFAWISEHRADQVGPMIAAMNAAALGEHERALDLLEQALEERDPYLILVSVTPELQPLAGNPRYLAVLRKVRGHG